MISFENDYNVGAHELILKKLLETNMDPQSGYGSDKYCDSAKKKIKMACQNENIDVFLLTGGTQTNIVCIDSLLQSYEGVICADTGHINVHEAGAIEYNGHKVFSLPSIDGKLSSKNIAKYLDTFESDENKSHMVAPKMVYISFPTELGTIYSKKELEEISKVCKEHDCYLFIDGARLGYGLMSKRNDVTLNDLSTLADAFYIGATKVGGIIGEALVYKKEITPKNMITIIKQHLALLAKGRLIGIQFDVLFTDNLYFNISKNAIEMAELLKNAFKENNYKFYVETITNQIFIVLNQIERERLSLFAKSSFIEKIGEDQYVIRFVTSFATKKEDVLEFISHLQKQKNC